MAIESLSLTAGPANGPATDRRPALTLKPDVPRTVELRLDPVSADGAQVGEVVVEIHHRRGGRWFNERVVTPTLVVPEALAAWAD